VANTTQAFHNQYEYLEPDSDEALLDSIDPSLARTAETLQRHRILAQFNAVYDQVDTPARRTFVSDERHVKVSAELIAERFGIGPTRAQRTLLRVTTQRAVRSAILPISRRYRADRVFGVKRLNGKFATDTAYGKVRSLRGNIGSQLYFHKCGFKASYPIQKINGDHVGDTLTQFISDYGAPEHLTFDGASVQTGPKTRFMDAIRKYEIKHHVSGPRRPNENPAEQSIHEVKKRWYRIMLKKKIPARLWDYGFNWVYGRPRRMRQPVKVCRWEDPRRNHHRRYARYIGISETSIFMIGSFSEAMRAWVKQSWGSGLESRTTSAGSCQYWILPPSGIPVSVTTVQRLTNDERNTLEMQDRMRQYDEKLTVLFEAQSADMARGLRACRCEQGHRSGQRRSRILH
jgi:hypothetical protein